MTRDLFDGEAARAAAPDGRGDVRARPTPLADRMRPRSLDEVEGPEEVVGANGFLRRADRRGPRPVAHPLGPARRRQDDAGAADRVPDLLALPVLLGRGHRGEGDARGPRGGAAPPARQGKRTILFLDEIHRFNRSQQDVFLPYVESGDIVLVGATTENPSFELNGALLSRCKVVVLEPLAPEAIARIVERALRDIRRGPGRARLPARRRRASPSSPRLPAATRAGR